MGSVQLGEGKMANSIRLGRTDLDEDAGRKELDLGKTACWDLDLGKRACSDLDMGACLVQMDKRALDSVQLGKKDSKARLAHLGKTDSTARLRPWRGSTPTSTCSASSAAV